MSAPVEYERTEAEVKVLEAIVDDARRARDGRPPVCNGCSTEIPDPLHVYRCTECTLPFHRRCAIKHFADSARPSTGETPNG